MTVHATAMIPGFIAGTWEIDPVHSEVSFTVRHMVVSKVRGRFDRFSGTILTNEDLTHSSVNVTIEAASINTNEPNRDNHVRSADFLDVESFPSLTFQSTAVRTDGDQVQVDGELTIRGTTRPVTLDVEVNGFTPDPYGGTRAGFSATTEINRQDFGVSFNGPIPGADNAMVLSDKVTLNLEVEAVLQDGAPPT
jgi:polyisoprenoid-binding protein YceI